MRKLFLLALTAMLAVLAIGLSAPSSASAGCYVVRCFNQQDAKLKQKVRVLTKAIVRIHNCLKVVPLTQYGDSTGGTYGYYYEPPSGPGFDTSALDQSAPGQPVFSWFVVDSCNKATVASNTRTALSATGHALSSGLFEALPISGEGAGAK
jgi:hypothetical protein